MVGIYKRITIALLSMSLPLGSLGGTEQVTLDPGWYSNAVQDVITYDSGEINSQSMDLFGAEAAPVSESAVSDGKGNIFFNNEPTSLDLLAEQMKGSDSICLYGIDYGYQKGLAGELAKLLLLIGETEIDDRFINLNMEYLPRQRSMDCDILEIAPDGALSFAGKPIDISDLPGLLAPDRKLGIESESIQPPPFSVIHEVIKTVGSKSIHHIFFPNRDQQVQVSAQIYQLNAAGELKVLAAPRITTAPGYPAAMRVVENQTGRLHYEPGLDTFHQEDLANLGIRLTATPQILGDCVRVRGVAILTKSMSREAGFQEKDIPIYSYSVNKTVAPFSVVLPIVNEGADIPIAEVDGKKTRCRISAVIVDHKGMSQKDRDMARAAAQQ